MCTEKNKYCNGCEHYEKQEVGLFNGGVMHRGYCKLLKRYVFIGNRSEEFKFKPTDCPYYNWDENDDIDELDVMLSHRSELLKKVEGTESKIKEYMGKLFEEFKKIQMSTPYPNHKKMPLKFGDKSVFGSIYYDYGNIHIIYYKENIWNKGEMGFLYIPTQYRTAEGLIAWFKKLVGNTVKEIEEEDENMDNFIDSIPIIGNKAFWNALDKETLKQLGDMCNKLKDRGII